MENGQVLWEGELIATGRKGELVKARIIFSRGDYLDYVFSIGTDLRLQTLDQKLNEWRKRSPHEFNPASFAAALVATK